MKRNSQFFLKEEAIQRYIGNTYEESFGENSKLGGEFFPPLTGIKWDKVFKNGLRKICGRQPLRNSFSPLLNPLPQMFDRLNQSSIGLSTLRKKFPNTEFFLVRIFPYSG